MSVATLSPPAAPPLMTAAEFLRDHLDAKGVELVNGRLVRTPMPGFDHDAIEGNVYALLREFVKMHDLGHVTCGETKIRIATNPDTFRASDVLYVSFAKLPRTPRPRGALLVPPDLVAEVRSPSDQPDAIDAKIRDYLDAGVRAVISVDPELEAVSIHRKDEIDVRFHNGDHVEIPDVLPGFRVPVKAFFE
jgi:Uma2 family endonuclease